MNPFVLSPALDHFFRFILWFFCGHSWPNWQQHYAAMHRKHHATSDTPRDPHSPHQLTVKQLLDYKHYEPGRPYYISQSEMELYASDVVSVNDWVERNVYCKYPKLGQQIFWILQTLLFGVIGFILGSIVYFWIGDILVISTNWLCHKVGYTPHGTSDKSKIVFPIGIIICGEELHAHHHNNASTPYFNRHWWEIDTGWWYCKLLMMLRLMKLTTRKSN